MPSRFPGRPSLPVLLASQVVEVRQAFLDHPDWNDLYLFWDGHIEGGDKFRQEFSGCTHHGAIIGGLVSIATQGIPVNISRGHKQINMGTTTAKEGK